MLHTSRQRPLAVAFDFFILSLLIWGALDLVVAIAHADTLVSTSAGAPAWLATVWNVVEPIATVLAATVGTPLALAIAYRLTSWIGAKDANAQKELETKLAAAIHQSAENGLKAALTRAGLPVLPDGNLPSKVLANAIDYVTSKNPEDLKKLGASHVDVADIVLSKVPDVLATVAMAKAALPIAR